MTVRTSGEAGFVFDCGCTGQRRKRLGQAVVVQSLGRGEGGRERMETSNTGGIGGPLSHMRIRSVNNSVLNAGSQARSGWSLGR